MNNSLLQLGNIPVTTSTLESLFPLIKGGNQKIRSLEKDKQIIRIKRGLYVRNPEITGKVLSTELVANHLYAPSDFPWPSTFQRRYRFLTSCSR